MHNLFHFARVADDLGVMHSKPNLSLRALADLAGSDVHELFHPLVLRTGDALQRVADNAAAFDARGDFDGANECYKSIIRNALRFLVFSGMFHAEWTTTYFAHPELRRLREMVGIMQNGGDVFVTCGSSEVGRDAASLRTYDTPVLCWLADEDVPGLRLVPMFQPFRDLPGIPTAI